MTETDVKDLEEIEQGLKACGLQEKETDKEGSNIDIILEPDNDGEDTCPQNVPAKYKTGTDKESPTAPKPLPRKMNDGDIKSDVDVKNIKLDIKLEPDNDDEDDCPLSVPAKYKTRTKGENPTALKLHPRRLNYEETKADVDIKNIKLDNELTEMIISGDDLSDDVIEEKLLPNDSRISRVDFDKVKKNYGNEFPEMARSDFPKTYEDVEKVLEAFVKTIRLKKENEHDTFIESLTLEGDTQKKLESRGFKGKIYHKKQSIYSSMPYFVKEELVSEEGRGGIVTESASSSFIIVFYRIVNDTPVIFLLPTAQNWHYVNKIACDSFPNQIDSKMMKDEFTYRELVDISEGPLKATEQHTKSGRVLPRENTNSNEIEGKVESPVVEKYRADLNIKNLRFKKDKKAIIVKGNLSFSDILNVLVMFSQICSEGETSNECPPIGIDDI